MIVFRSQTWHQFRSVVQGKNYYVVAEVLDELFASLDEKDIAVLVIVPNVTCVDPAIAALDFFGGFRIIPVTLESRRSFQANFAQLTNTQSSTAGLIYHLHLVHR